jgi:hypothetical protein
MTSAIKLDPARLWDAVMREIAACDMGDEAR